MLVIFYVCNQYWTKYFFQCCHFYFQISKYKYVKQTKMNLEYMVAWILLIEHNWETTIVNMLQIICCECWTFNFCSNLLLARLDDINDYLLIWPKVWSSFWKKKTEVNNAFTIVAALRRPYIITSHHIVKWHQHMQSNGLQFMKQWIL